MIRSAFKTIKSEYDININEVNEISPKALKLVCNNGQCYFVKETNLLANEKYNFLYGQGLGNVLYPIKSKKERFTAFDNANSYYVMPYISSNNVINEVKATSMTQELMGLHSSTSFKTQLTPKNSRKKMEDMYEYLEYKFNVLELFVRSIESRKFDEYSIVILKNYHIILDTKKDLARLQKKIITDIKSKKSVNMAFIHNNPKLEHLLVNGGSKYFISLEKSKIGISSLDLAKFYIENEDLNVDIYSLITEYFMRYDDTFYYDYFCFLVMFYYIKGLKIIDKDYVSSQSFLNTSESLQKFRKLFIETNIDTEPKSK